MAGSDIHRFGVIHSDLPHHCIELRWQTLPQAQPVLTAVVAAIKPPARRGIQTCTVRRWRHRVDVPIESLVQTLPRLALIRTAINAALLDADVHRTDDLWVRNHRAHVGDVWRRWEGPALVAWNAADGLARPPAGPTVVAPI